MATKYCISFDTKDVPGRIKAVWVELGVLYMKDPDVVRVDLANHPLYRELEEYVLANPSRKKSKKPT